jgi:ABC-type phosphate transport system substrate-binding protein
MRVVSKITVVAAAAATVLGVGLGPALADPNFTPAATDVVGVGSDTTQLVMDQIAKDYDATHTPKLASWDAVNPSTGGTGDPIATKAGCATIPRPNGSSAGIAAVDPAKEVNPTGSTGDRYCIDYARSSRGKATVAPFDPNWLLWVGYGKDAVSWTTPNSGTGKPATLTIAQLKSIYSANTGACLTWNQVGGTSTAAILPVLPQTSSGTRKFFLTAIGVTTVGTCTVNGSINIPGDTHNPVPIEENTGVSQSDSGGFLTGNQYEFNTATNHANVLFPYSVADWIAQTPAPRGGGHATASSAPGILLQPQKVSGVSPILQHNGPPITIDTINPAFTATLTRVVWNVMENDGTQSAPKIPAYLAPFFGPTGAVCSDKAAIQSYGFELLGTNGSLCGTTFQATPTPAPQP